MRRRSRPTPRLTPASLGYRSGRWGVITEAVQAQTRHKPPAAVSRKINGIFPISLKPFSGGCDWGNWPAILASKPITSISVVRHFPITPYQTEETVDRQNVKFSDYTGIIEVMPLAWS